MKVSRLERFLRQYRSEEINDFTQIAIAVSNEAFLVSCTSGSRYVIRIIHLQTKDSVRAEVLIQQTMLKHGLSTPCYVRLKNGEFVGSDGPDSFTIASYIKGSHPDKATLKLVRSLGTTMAKLHIILDQTSIAIGYNTGQWLHPRNVAKDLIKCDSKIRARVQPLLDYNSDIFDKGLPMAVIHGELATNNIFAENSRVTTVFDFETTQYAPRILDLAYTYLSVAYDEKLKPESIFRALKTGYDGAAETKLTSAEKYYFNMALRYVCAATSTWCFSRGYDEYGEQFLRAGASTTQLRQPRPI
jgi:Ser/Thr protein kinase RdoA (MazF antagonist)